MTYEFPRNTTGGRQYYWPSGQDYFSVPYVPDPTWQCQVWYNCPHCSKLIKVESAYCSHCGAKLITEETEEDKLDAIIGKLDELIEIVKSK